MGKDQFALIVGVITFSFAIWAYRKKQGIIYLCVACALTIMISTIAGTSYESESDKLGRTSATACVFAAAWLASIAVSKIFDRLKKSKAGKIAKGLVVMTNNRLDDIAKLSEDKDSQA